MQRSLIYLILFTCLCASTWATDGVKGGHRSRYPTSGSHHVGTNSSQNALCYKTVPYSHVLALNSSGSPYNTIPQPPGGSSHNDGWITILDCCDGYQRNVTSGQCEPHCDRGCFGGRCTGPNICSCPSGWHPEDGVCLPVCMRPCQENAYCFSPEMCVCKLGYDEVHGQCKPICPDGCGHGECVAPRVCGCRSGYTLNERKECVAACEGGCEHGTCSAPGLCTCREGYTNPPGDRESCVPHCQGGCSGGECVAPGVCSCRPGYTRDRYSGRCYPGNPNLPQCGPGYTLDPNGRCVPAARPPITDSSQCAPGYVADPDTNRCMPPSITVSPLPDDCRYGCGPNSFCVRDSCVCRLGFIIAPNTGVCVPVPSHNSTSSQCRYGCGPHGRCVGPNACVCDPGAHRDPNTGMCVRHEGDDTGAYACQHPCLNGRCTGPDQCTCNRGYTLDIQDSTFSRCVPVCEDGCPNGVCTMPNLCICNPGYRKTTGVKGGRARCVRVQE